ncbi:MAG: PDZ domain-containing protein, partial [Saprospiraceae bacterium]|nr:PDZ domain-containing protein [Saprospiraceae bacterium]
ATEKKVTTLGPGYRYQLYWSPDSKRIAFIDQTMTIQLCNVEDGTVEKIDQEIALFEGGLRGFALSWSSDSRYVAYDKTLENTNSAIFIYDVEGKSARQVTSGFYSDHFPIFDPDGKYLYISTNRSFKPVYSDFDDNWSYPNATGLAAIALRDDVPSPLAPANDTVAIVDDEADEADDEEEESDDEEEEEDKDEELEIDFEGFERRLIMLPPKPGNIGRLAAVSGKVIFHRFPNSGTSEGKSSVRYYDLEEEEEKEIMQDVRLFKLTSDGKKLMIRKGSQIGIVDVAADQKLEDMVALGDMESTIVPMKEWKQIFTDAWRFERDFFYDKSMHGVDWNGLREHYGDLIQHCMNRSDVNFVIGELIGELNASHTYRGGGDQEQAAQKSVGYLGLDWTLTDGHYQVKNIIRAADWNDEVRSPLDMPGVDVNDGDFILAVNGTPLNEYSDPWDALEGLAGKTVELTVNTSPSFSDAKTVVVEPLASETRLRHLAWIEKNRKEVEEKSGGKIGYIYVPSTGVSGQNELVRQFYAQWNKEGLIVDERFNNGGQIPDRFIELLNRKPLAYWSVRDGKNWQWPRVAHFGSMAMLINGWAGSGGDAFPDYFRKAGLGPLIGTRTWGGLIGLSGSPTLIDGGAVTVPTFRMYNPDGTWFKEGHGVDPDLEVKEDPTQLAKGVDTQLQAAIQQVLEQMKKRGPIHPKEPAKEKRT